MLPVFWIDSLIHVEAAMQIWQCWHRACLCAYATFALWCVQVRGISYCLHSRGQCGMHQTSSLNWTVALTHSMWLRLQCSAQWRCGKPISLSQNTRQTLSRVFIYSFLQLKSVIMSVTLWHFQEPLVAGTGSHPLQMLQLGCWSNISRIFVYKVKLKGVKKKKSSRIQIR